MFHINDGQLSDYVLLKTATAANAEINFTSIPPGWKYFFIQGQMASNAGNAVYLQFNGDAGANYIANRIDYGGGAISNTNQGATATPYVGVTNSTYEVGNEFRICQPAAGQMKSCNAWAYHGSGGRIASFTWTNTVNEISSILIKPTAGTFTGKMTLYGAKVL
jgi:hypothetical protein